MREMLQLIAAHMLMVAMIPIICKYDGHIRAAIQKIIETVRSEHGPHH